MPLIHCPICDHNVSDKALTCPSCGHPFSSEQNYQTPATEAPSPSRLRMPETFSCKGNLFSSHSSATYQTRIDVPHQEIWSYIADKENLVKGLMFSITLMHNSELAVEVNGDWPYSGTTVYRCGPGAGRNEYVEILKVDDFIPGEMLRFDVVNYGKDNFCVERLFELRISPHGHSSDINWKADYWTCPYKTKGFAGYLSGIGIDRIVSLFGVDVFSAKVAEENLDRLIGRLRSNFRT